MVVPIDEQVWMGENLVYLPSVNNLSQKSDTEACYYFYDYNRTVLMKRKRPITIIHTEHFITGRRQKQVALPAGTFQRIMSGRNWRLTLA